MDTFHVNKETLNKNVTFKMYAITTLLVLNGGDGDLEFTVGKEYLDRQVVEISGDGNQYTIKTDKGEIKVFSNNVVVFTEEKPARTFNVIRKKTE